MSNANIARPYAKAAFTFAKQTNHVPHWSAALRVLSMAVQNSAIVALLKNPSVTGAQAVALLSGVLCDSISHGVSKLDQGLENFLQLLAEYKRLSVLPDIATLFEADVAKDQGYLQLTVTSAFPLSDVQQTKIAAQLKTTLASDVTIRYENDSTIIGGIVVRSGHWVLDDSVRGRLARLQSALGPVYNSLD